MCWHRMSSPSGWCSAGQGDDAAKRRTRSPSWEGLHPRLWTRCYPAPPARRPVGRRGRGSSGPSWLGNLLLSLRGEGCVAQELHGVVSHPLRLSSAAPPREPSVNAAPPSPLSSLFLLPILPSLSLIFSFSRRDRSMALDRFERCPSLAGRRRARTPRVRWDPG